MQRIFESAAIDLGKALIEKGATNQRMENWIKAFELWAKNNV